MSRTAISVAGLLIVLCACAPEGEARKEPGGITPLAFWRVEVVEDSGGQTGEIAICANQELVGSFARVEPKINGQPCLRYGKDAKDTADERIGRCQADGLRYGRYLTITRKAEDDFTVRFALQPLQAAGGKVVQARRYHRVGDCPADWQGGDQGPPGGAPTSNLMTGERYAARAE